MDLVLKTILWAAGILMLVVLIVGVHNGHMRMIQMEDEIIGLESENDVLLDENARLQWELDMCNRDMVRCLKE